MCTLEGMIELTFFSVILLSAVFHEYMHAWAADQMGDPTPRDLGRLTLNPLPHIDPIFTLLLPAALYIGTSGQFMFASAKPVPFNPYNLKFPRFGPALVGLAGPAGNFLIAIIFGLILRTEALSFPLMVGAVIIVYANVLLGVFNLVPIPPLDGSHILRALFPERFSGIMDTFEQYGLFVFAIFLVFFSWIIYPIVSSLTRLIAGPAVSVLFGA